MTVYFQHVGERGGSRDFPKTIGTAKSGLKQFSFAEIEPHLQNLPPGELTTLRNDLKRYSPNGFQIWGIPAGAKSILKNLSVGDYLLLLEAATPGGAFAYGGCVVAVPSMECFDFSEHLWGEAKFPLIVFMKGTLTNYPWQRFCELVGYETNWNPAGQTYRIIESRLQHAGCNDDEDLVELILGTRFQLLETAGQLGDIFEDPVEEFFSTVEGRQFLRQHLHLERSLKLVREFKKSLLTFECSICSFDFEAIYGNIGRDFIEAHHTKPLSEMNGAETVHVEDLVAVCSNCHRMLHRTMPALQPSQLGQRLVDAFEKRNP